LADRLVTVLAGMAALLAVAVAAPASADDVAFRFQDDDITESSGLVIDGDLAYTTNDSGDRGRIFAIDLRTGRTVGVTEWADEARDVEALAPAGPGEVWVADIGDNDAERDAIEVTRVPVGRGERRVEAETYELTYPDGPVDAETLLADPRTGRLYVVTKQVFTGTVYAAPAQLSPDGANVLTPIGTGPGIATDGAFFPDGRHLVIRSYDDAVVYTWPGLTRVTSFDLPAQEQGEGLAVGADNSLWLSSEGVHAPVLHLGLPTPVHDAMAGQTAAPSTSPTPAASPTPSPSGPDPSRATDPSRPADPASHDAWPWLLGLLFFLGAAAVLIRSLRPR